MQDDYEAIKQELWRNAVRQQAMQDQPQDIPMESAARPKKNIFDVDPRSGQVTPAQTPPADDATITLDPGLGMMVQKKDDKGSGGSMGGIMSIFSSLMGGMGGMGGGGGGMGGGGFGF